MLQILFCDSEAGLRIMGFMGILVSIIKTVIPIILIVIGTISLVKCLISSDKNNTKNEIINLIKKCILALVIFFLPSLVIFLINLVADNTNGQKCMSCLLEDASGCMRKAENIKQGKTDTLCSINNGNPDKCMAPCQYTNGYCQKVD